jgi:autotransporter-associated beta strand protein
VIPNTIGSIEGEGQIRLADTQLTIGSNDLSTTFSGLIEDYGYYNETGGSLIKIGRGTLSLTHDNTFTGGVRVKRGVLLINNTTGSGTGPGKVQVEGGTLGGKGFIGGLVTVGTGGSQRAVLAPGTDGLAVLTMLRTLTFGTNSAYNWNVDTQSVRSDGIAANGVTISAGALFTIFPRRNASIPIGSIFTAIDNTAATAISGTFINLPDGGVVTVGNNTFQANYEGGDGNDLTLTVIP